MVLPASRRIPRVPRYSGYNPGRFICFDYGTITRCGYPFHGIRLQIDLVTSRGLRTDLQLHPTTSDMQRARAYTYLIWALPISLAATLGIDTFFLFLRVLRCFTSPRSLLQTYGFSKEISGHYPRWVSPFGNPRIKACLAAPRGLSQLTTSFIASWRQGIHHLPLVA
jgi:hypothetical protein